MNIHENAKDEVLHQEGNSYFERNLKNGKIDVSIGCQLFGDFLNDTAESITDKKVLEVGCCYGYNLMWLCEKYDWGGVRNRTIQRSSFVWKKDSGGRKQYQNYFEAGNC